LSISELVNLHVQLGELPVELPVEVPGELSQAFQAIFCYPHLQIKARSKSGDKDDQIGKSDPARPASGHTTSGD
jgi:hypothetical protein